MIWAWIAAAVVISWLFCNKKINWYHYIWLLLPIEMYGVTIAGVTLKPYMLFGFFIIARDIIKNRTIRVHTAMIAVVLALIISDCLTGFLMPSIMQHIMFVLVLMIGYSYQNYQSDGIEFDEMGQAALATTIGYGIVFTIAWLMFNNGIVVDGIYASERLETGILLRRASFGGIVSSRLRGFCIDPNSVITTLIPGAAYAMDNIVRRNQKRAKSLIAIAFYLAVVIYSGSRMALLCSFAMLIIFFVIGYKKAKNKRRAVVIGLVVVGAFLIVSVLKIDSLVPEIERMWTDLFGERASLDSEYGRLTIWRTNTKYLVKNNKEWLGVGQNQIYLLTGLGLACHNTWLEWICGTGVFIGIVIDLWFILAPIRFRKRTLGVGNKNIQGALPTIMAYVTVIVCISTVDNITNSVLLFLMLILRYGAIK